MTGDKTASDRAITAEVIVPVHDGLEFVRPCLESVRASLGPGHAIIVVDDGSQAPTQEYCASFVAGEPRARLIRRPQGSGFTKAANAGLRQSEADCQILLNSDTLVAKGWIEKLIRCGQTMPDIGLVGPLSGAASWQSIPEIHAPDGGLAVNELPEGMRVEDMDRLCEEWSRNLPFPRTNLLNGFCLAIKRELKASIGLLDEINFPKGYGEENDYCLRAGDAGFGLLVAIDTYVYHAKSKTYSDEGRRELAKQGSMTLRRLYGKERVDRAVKSMQTHPILVTMRERARNHLVASKRA